MAEENHRFSIALTAAFASAGVRHACITPGSRSAPIAMALAANPAITDWSHHDERSSAFFALGIGKATGGPAVVVTTSGTAAAELHPAVVEARYGRVPLIVVTADRPADLRDVGAPQAIDQTKLFGDGVRWAHDLEPSDRIPSGYAAALAARLVAQALEVPPGPVHLNLRFREPFSPPDPIGDKLAVAPRVAPAMPPTADPDVVEDLGNRLRGSRTLVIAGPQDDVRLGSAVARLAGRAGLPVLADPLSQVRIGRHDLGQIVAAGDLLAEAGWLDRTAPEAVLRIGGLPTSKPLWTWLEAHPDIPQIVIDSGDWREPLATAAEIIRADPIPVLSALASADPRAPSGWWPQWMEADAVARAALDRALSKEAFPTEPGVVRSVVDALADGSSLWVGSSMPVRDLDMVAPSSPRDLRFGANRGANGIDGFISSGLGAAAAGDRPTYLLAGDLSLVHDLTALSTAARLGVAATVVIIDNNGGGIFHFLAHVKASTSFERHFGTPHGLDLIKVSEALGVPASAIETPADLGAAVAAPPEGPRLLVVRTDRSENVAVHQRIRTAVANALR